ncbi:unnamed protein product [Sphagnum jensenii]|uniref:Uncharacterized protein n=1 Tax=Sphagnum jensenii TaxID=128206 RepID=A0ABP1C097_9BRYO
MRFGSLGLQSSSALAFLHDLLRPISWKDLGCSAQDHVSRRRSRAEEEEEEEEEDLGIRRRSWWVLVLKDVRGRGAGPKPAEACKIHFHSCGGGGGALDLRASRNVIRSVQHWRRIEAHE